MGRGTPAGLEKDEGLWLGGLYKRPKPGLQWRVVVRWALS